MLGSFDIVGDFKSNPSEIPLHTHLGWLLLKKKKKKKKKKKQKITTVGKGEMRTLGIAGR